MSTPYGAIACTSAAWDAFQECCSKPNENGCILWRKPESKGYGRFYFGNMKYPTHRMAWRFAHGEVPNGLFVCHKCDVPLCVNPDHLFLGTNQDNVDDMVRKGRHAPCLAALRKYPLAWGNLRGAKLTEAQALEILRRYTSTKISMAAISKDYCVGKDAVRKLVTGQSWRHLPRPAQLIQFPCDAFRGNGGHTSSFTNSRRGRRQFPGARMLTLFLFWIALQLPIGICVGKVIKQGMRS